MKIVYFATAAEFRDWLEHNHATTTQLQVGFYKKSSGKKGMTYQEAVDEALCFGWIDGIIRRIDADCFTHRFTPRRPGSTWSNINVGHAERLLKAGKMHPAGIQTFAARKAAKTGVYTYEQANPPTRPQAFPKALAAIFRVNRAAWKFWQLQPPGYQRTAIWWVISAKQEPTRLRRLQRVIAASAAGQRIGY